MGIFLVMLGNVRSSANRSSLRGKIQNVVAILALVLLFFNFDSQIHSNNNVCRLSRK